MSAPSSRLLALDVFRGLTVASMLLVNNPGTWSAVYAPLEHAEWHGWTPTDLIFPFFLFIVGVTTHLSLTAARERGASDALLIRKIVKRGALIVLCGLALNAFPFFWWGKMKDVADPTLFDRIAWRFDHLRFPGVLQRIGIVYTIAALVWLKTSARARWAVVFAILVGYWTIMTKIPVPGTGATGLTALADPSNTVAAYVDRLVIGTQHMWVSTKTWDPEGVLSTLPAIATALLGTFVGARLSDDRKPLAERALGLYGIGILGLVLGLLWGRVFPINKNLWTSSYVVFTAGFATAILATCIWTIDVLGWRRWTKPFVPFGVNPLFAFLGSGAMARVIDSLIKVPYEDGRTSLHDWSYKVTFARWFEPHFASLLWGLSFVALWGLVLWAMHKRGIIVKL